jgi:hypothetical protein
LNLQIFENISKIPDVHSIFLKLSQKSLIWSPDFLNDFNNPGLGPPNV